MAPMTRECAADGVPTPEMAAYYRRRAVGGVGLIITEGAAPNLTGNFGTTIPRLYGDDALAGWANIVAGVHEHDAAMLAQLWHVGAFNPSLIGMHDSFQPAPRRLSPSGLAGPDVPCGDVMTETDIADTIGAFADACEAAQRCGFDGIEIHGGHGYLPDQFFWPATNVRRDRYGGKIANRVRFAVELVTACRRRVGTAFPISFRFSQWKQLDYNARIVETPRELAALLEPLSLAGVTLFHCSTRRFWEAAFNDSGLTLAAWTKKLSGKPVIAVGSVTLGNDFKSAYGKVRAEAEPEQLQTIQDCIARNDFDLIAIGRGLLANPDWVHIMQQGRPEDLAPFSKQMIDEFT